MNSQAVEKFGNKIRVRVCGLFFRGPELLLINHKGLYKHDFWAPPGGGIEFGETAEMALKREFWEECGLSVETTKFLFACELAKPPLHAIELFFLVKASGIPRLGIDPEMGENQMITEVKFWSSNAIKEIPDLHRHGIFRLVKDTPQIPDLNGFYTIT